MAENTSGAERNVREAQEKSVEAAVEAIGLVGDMIGTVLNREKTEAKIVSEENTQTPSLSDRANLTGIKALRAVYEQNPDSFVQHFPVGSVHLKSPEASDDVIRNALIQFDSVSPRRDPDYEFLGAIDVDTAPHPIGVLLETERDYRGQLDVARGALSKALRSDAPFNQVSDAVERVITLKTLIQETQAREQENTDYFAEGLSQGPELAGVFPEFISTHNEWHPDLSWETSASITQEPSVYAGISGDQIGADDSPLAADKIDVDAALEAIANAPVGEPTYSQSPDIPSLDAAINEENLNALDSYKASVVEQNSSVSEEPEIGNKVSPARVSTAPEVDQTQPRTVEPEGISQLQKDLAQEQAAVPDESFHRPMARTKREAKGEVKGLVKGIKAELSQALGVRIKEPRIYSGSSLVYPPKRGVSITPQMSDRLKRAFTDPSSIDGSIKISIRNEKGRLEPIYQVSNGEVLIDKFNLQQSMHARLSSQQSNAPVIESHEPERMQQEEAKTQTQEVSEQAASKSETQEIPEPATTKIHEPEHVQQPEYKTQTQESSQQPEARTEVQESPEQPAFKSEMQETSEQSQAVQSVEEQPEEVQSSPELESSEIALEKTMTVEEEKTTLPSHLNPQSADYIDLEEEKEVLKHQAEVEVESHEEEELAFQTDEALSQEQELETQQSVEADEVSQGMIESQERSPVEDECETLTPQDAVQALPDFETFVESFPEGFEQMMGVEDESMNLPISIDSDVVTLAQESQREVLDPEGDRSFENEAEAPVESEVYGKGEEIEAVSEMIEPEAMVNDVLESVKFESLNSEDLNGIQRESEGVSQQFEATVDKLQAGKAPEPLTDSVEGSRQSFNGKVGLLLNFAKERISQKVNHLVSGVEGAAIHRAGSFLVKSFGKEQADGSKMMAHGNKYSFQLKGEALSISRKGESSAIFKDGRLTENATKVDAVDLKKVPLAVGKIRAVQEKAQRQQSRHQGQSRGGRSQ